MAEAPPAPSVGALLGCVQQKQLRDSQTQIAGGASSQWHITFLPSVSHHGHCPASISCRLNDPVRSCGLGLGAGCPSLPWGTMCGCFSGVEAAAWVTSHTWGPMPRTSVETQLSAGPLPASPGPLQISVVTAVSPGANGVMAPAGKMAGHNQGSCRQPWYLFRGPGHKGVSWGEVPAWLGVHLQSKGE